MNKSKVHFFWSGSAALLLFFSLLPQAAHAFGVSPATIQVDNLLPGSKTKQVLSVSHTDILQSSIFDVAVNGTGGVYIELLSKEATIPAGQQRIDFPFTIVIPEAVTSGSYNADISFIVRTPTQEKDSGSGLTLRQGVVVSVGFSVTQEQQSTFTIRDTGFEVTNTKEPVNFYYRLVNDGNISSGPDRAVIVLTPVGQTGEKKEVSVQNLPLVEPKQTEMVRTHLFDSLSAGRYAVHISFFSGDTLVLEEQGKQFLVISPPDGALSKAVSRFSIFRRFLFISLVTTVIIFIAYSYFLYRKRPV